MSSPSGTSWKSEHFLKYASVLSRYPGRFSASCMNRFCKYPGTKSHIRTSWLGHPRGLRGKEFAASEGEAGSIPGSGRPPGGGHGQHPSILAWRVPCTEEPGGLQSMRSNRGRHNRAAGTVAPSYYGFPFTWFLILTLLFLISKGHSSFIPPP